MLRGVLCGLFLVLVLPSLCVPSVRGDETPPNSLQTKCKTDIPQDCTQIRDCATFLKSKPAGSGVYTIKPMGYPMPFYVYCDMATDGGGWTVFQDRRDGSVDFYKGWADYTNGFGRVDREHWLGNDKLSYITAQGLYELRVDMSDFDDETRFAKYDYFSVGDEGDVYRLSLGNYNGTAGDSLSYHNGAMFSTKDRSNVPDINCAILNQGAWWYKYCHTSNLNGLYLGGTTDVFADGVVWYYWHGHYYSLKTTRMKTRRISKII